jgi:hypothetical protein
MFSERRTQYRQQQLDLGVIALFGLFNGKLRQVVAQDIFRVRGQHGGTAYGVVSGADAQLCAISLQPAIEALVDKSVRADASSLPSRHGAQRANSNV